MIFDVDFKTKTIYIFSPVNVLELSDLLKKICLSPEEWKVAPLFEYSMSLS